MSRVQSAGNMHRPNSRYEFQKEPYTYSRHFAIHAPTMESIAKMYKSTRPQSIPKEIKDQSNPEQHMGPNASTGPTHASVEPLTAGSRSSRRSDIMMSPATRKTPFPPGPTMLTQPNVKKLEALMSEKEK